MESVDLPVPAPRRVGAELKPLGSSIEYEPPLGLMDSPPRPRAHARRQRRRQLSNPLLDTISAIADDDDECCAEKADGYMGGSSVDSGYKSCCPTPEMVDIAYYSTTVTPAAAGDQQKRLSVASQASQSSTASLPGSGGGQKPRIAMGTKVMSRQGSCAPAPEPRRRHDSGFSDAAAQPAVPQSQEQTRLQEQARLQEQVRLPQAVVRGALTDAEVVQLVLRPRSSSVGSAVAGSPPLRRRGSPGAAARQRPLVRHSSPHLPPSHPQQQRRRSSPSPCRPPRNSGGEPPRRPPPQGAAPPKPARTGQRTPAATSRATRERDTPAATSRATRERDIDTIICGRQPNTGASGREFLGDFTGAANVRWPSPCTPSLLSGQLSPPVEQLHPPAAGQPPSSRPQPLKAAALKSKFSHMAQCMLDIIDELHGRGRSGSGAQLAAGAAPSPPAQAGTEYHTYEEVLYGALVERVREAAPSPEPPPLPLRPLQLFPSVRDVRAAPVPPAARLHPAKQRNNFYSLFKSVGERRCLSHHLQHEVSAGDGDADEYGFAIRK